MDSQLLDAVTTELDDIEDDEIGRDERLEVVEVPATIELVDDGEGVGEIVLSSSVDAIVVRVELVKTVDCAGGWAIYLVSHDKQTPKVYSR